MGIDLHIEVQRARVTAAEEHERVMLDIACDAEARWKDAKQKRIEENTQFGRLLEERERICNEHEYDSDCELCIRRLHGWQSE